MSGRAAEVVDGFDGDVCGNRREHVLYDEQFCAYDDRHLTGEDAQYPRTKECSGTASTARRQYRSCPVRWNNLSQNDDHHKTNDVKAAPVVIRHMRPSARKRRHWIRHLR